jgi:hypothetical protein
MTKVEFEENLSSLAPQRIPTEDETTGMEKVLMDTGVVKSKIQAQVALIVIIILCIIITIVVLAKSRGRREQYEPAPMALHNTSVLS